jgi:hypothetical protein
MSIRNRAEQEPIFPRPRNLPRSSFRGCWGPILPPLSSSITGCMTALFSSHQWGNRPYCPTFCPLPLVFPYRTTKSEMQHLWVARDWASSDVSCLNVARVDEYRDTHGRNVRLFKQSATGLPDGQPKREKVLSAILTRHARCQQKFSNVLSDGLCSYKVQPVYHIISCPWIRCTIAHARQCRFWLLVVYQQMLILAHQRRPPTCRKNDRQHNRTIHQPCHTDSDNWMVVTSPSTEKSRQTTHQSTTDGREDARVQY